jgi:hypothetical protein
VSKEESESASSMMMGRRERESVRNESEMASSMMGKREREGVRHASYTAQYIEELLLKVKVSQ